MKHKFFLLLVIFMFFCVSAGFATEAEFEKGDFWLCPSGEAALYSYSGITYGYGFALGYGRGTSIGVKAIWFPGSEGVNVLEINCLLRFYFSGNKAYSGTFLQFMGGPTLFWDEMTGFSLPAKVGAFSIGAGLGWRILILDRIYIEPCFRAGYPYAVGAGISVGVRF
jgi:hypothetical protein